METCLTADFEKVCRICMKFHQTFLSINSFKIIDMIITCASVQIWENDDLPNQICNDCFLQLHNSINFKQLCENSDNAFRQIIQQSKISLSNNQDNFENVKDEDFENYTDDNSLIDIKQEDIPVTIKNEITLENVKIIHGQNEDGFKNSKTNNMLEIKNYDSPELNKVAVQTKSEEPTDPLDNIKISTGQDNSKTLKTKQILEITGKNRRAVRKILVRTESEKESDTDEDTSGDEKAETFNCDYCEKCNNEYKTVWALSQHIQRNHKVKPIKCNKCKLQYYHPQALNRHEKLMHTNHICYKCNKKFSNIYKLKVHNKRSHNEEARSREYVTCDICGKLIQKKNIKNHLIIHKERDKIACDICSKTFLYQITLNNHIKLVHENQKPERRHLCNICGHAARGPAELREHLRTHSTERPYSCKHCDKTYRRADSLKEHISHVHLNERNYQCTLCPQAFHDKKSLTNHIQRHTGEKPHKCEVCSKAFLQKSTLKTHTKIHTNSKENLMQS